MGRNIKDTDTVYKKARIEASSFNDKLRSREGTSEILGVSPSSLLNYETGVCKQIPTDVVVKMAEIYNAPELMNYYCCKECPIGKYSVPHIEVLEMDRITIQIVSSLENINEVKKELLDITEDGIITEYEKPKLDHIVKTLDKISVESQELKLWVQKNIERKGSY
ncbi:helix-turn-helix transcriptional regulator [Clostridium sp. AWRP]|uniref:helix-turn-helix domain-containing protein n=1 Tax=Clostridium sp. AWRP TaxID=2212991 RepID=UPI000FD77F50|nr:helix-turn-helix transcriptional regulator [Clostridium sp. AWRP]AZV56772.1 XRE family transcriptional regulator [Clostridium sp. AWRP]